MKKTLLFLIASVAVLSGMAQSTAEKIDAYLTAANKANKFNGSVLVANKSGILINKGYGWRDAANKIKHNENSIFQIGSITKQFTATVILSLQEKGKLSVKDKLSKYFPKYPFAEKITIENLLTHTSGIYNYTNDTAFMMHEAIKPLSQTKFWSLIAGKPLDFEPGTKFSYSNSGYLILGYIIEKATGKKYEQVVRQTIFAPAGMRSSGFDFTHLSSPNKTIGYDDDSLQTPAVIVDSSTSFAAGAIYTITSDLYKWNKTLLAGKIISLKSLNQAFTPYKNHYGFGWGIDSIDGKRSISHGGGIFGFVSDGFWIPEDSVCVILLNNFGTDLSPLTKDIVSILYDKPVAAPKEKTEITVADSILQHYVGEYALAPTFKITITVENGGLKAQATGQPQFDLFAETESRFFLKVVDAQVDFIKGADGKIEKLILHQGGRDIPGMKVK